MNGKIKILIIPTGGLRREGITSSQLEYTKRLDKNKFEITVAAVHNNAQDVIDEFRSNGCEVVELPDRKNKKKLLSYCIALKAEMRKGYDIVHVHGNSAIIAIELTIAKKCGIKVRIAHSRNTMCDNPKVDKLLRPIMYKNYTYAMACGKDAGDWLFPGREFELFHNGKDFTKFYFSADERKKIRHELGAEDRIVYGHVGNINKQKNHKFLLEVFDEIYKKQNNALLYIMGDGILMKEIKELVKNKGLSDSVVFAGRVSDVHRRLQAMDVMIFPSLFEGLPNVVLEWQAEGLPCLISDSITNECAVTELVHFKSLDDPAASWAEDAMRLPLTDEKRNALSDIAVKKLTEEGYEINKSVKHLAEIYCQNNTRMNRK